jgi:cytochrome P450
LFLIAVEKHLDKPMEMARWTAYFAFDVTEDLAFNKTSNMLRDGTDSYIFTKIRDDMRNLGITSRLPWLTNIIISTPILNRDFWSFWEWVQSRLDVRIKNEPEIPDIFSWILDEFNKGSKTQKDIYKLRANSQLIVVAGSDTASATLTHVFFWLAWDPELRARLQAELDALPDLSNEHLTHASLLNAIISETLRLNPPVISGTQRQTPPEGLRIGDRHIPGNVLVNVPNYVICRDARYFDKPTEFIPERWTTRPELNRDPSVYIPFNIGPYGCIGKRLAMMKIRMLLAQLLARYDLRMAPGETKEKFFESALDTFTLIPGELPVIWTKRSEPGSMEQAKK